MGFRDGLECYETVVLAMWFCLLALFPRLSVLANQRINVEPFLINLVTEVFDELTVVLYGVLFIQLD